MPATNQFPSKVSLSSRIPPHTPRLVKPLHPLPNPRSRSVRPTTAAASSVSQRSSRCATSGLNSPNPRVYRGYSLGLFSSLSSWPFCATPRTEGPDVLARSKHTKIKPFHFVVPRFPSITRFRSSLSLRRLLILTSHLLLYCLWDDYCTSLPHPLMLCIVVHLPFRLSFFNFLDYQQYPNQFTRSLYVPIE